MEPEVDRTIVRLRVTENPVTTTGSLLTETYALVYGLVRADQSKFVHMASQALRENDINWFHVEQNVTEAHTGSQGVTAEIVLWVTTNADAITAGILSNVLFTALQAGLSALNANISKTESVNYVERAEQHRTRLQQATSDSHLRLETIQANRSSVVYVFTGNTCKYEVEERGDKFVVKKLVV